MKISTGLMELIITMVFLIASTPLLLLLIQQSNMSEFTYINDKTMYTVSTDMTYKYDHQCNLVPPMTAGVTLDISQAACLPLVQDDACPEEARQVVYAFSSDTLPTSTNNGIVHHNGNGKCNWGDLKHPEPNMRNLSSLISSSSATYKVQAGWKALRDDVYRSINSSAFSSTVKNAIMTQDDSEYLTDDVYLVWNSTNDCWMLTRTMFNMFAPNN